MQTKHHSGFRAVHRAPSRTPIRTTRQSSLLRPPVLRPLSTDSLDQNPPNELRSIGKRPPSSRHQGRTRSRSASSPLRHDLTAPEPSGVCHIWHHCARSRPSRPVLLPPFFTSKASWLARHEPAFSDRPPAMPAKPSTEPPTGRDRYYA